MAGTTYDDLPDGVVVTDAQGVVAVVNRAAVRITGLDPVAMLGRPLAEALPLADLEGRLWWDHVDPWASLRTVTGHPERSLVLPDGREVYVTARYLREPPDRGPVARVVVGLRDTRARAREETSRAELVSSVAHELRSPLTSVKGFTATLLAKWERFTDAQRRLMLETVEADADRVTRLITELLDIGRIDSGRLEVRRQPINVGAVVRRHVAAMVAAGHSPDRFQLAVSGALGELWADADKLDQVLGNLLENAVRHGDGLVTVTVEPVIPEGRAAEDRKGVDRADGTAIVVADKGEGMAPEVAARVFTKFWRSGTRGGTGLGLYISRGLVEAHGGTITIGRTPGGGALFRVVLPAAVPEMPEPAPPSTGAR